MGAKTFKIRVSKVGQAVKSKIGLVRRIDGLKNVKNYIKYGKN